VDVKRVKDQMMTNIGERYKIIENCIRVRIATLGDTIEDDVEEHIRVISSDDFDHPERGSIEELSKVKKYIE
jgi:hypothetical protein